MFKILTEPREHPGLAILTKLELLINKVDILPRLEISLEAEIGLMMLLPK